MSADDAATEEHTPEWIEQAPDRYEGIAEAATEAATAVTAGGPELLRLQAAVLAGYIGEDAITVAELLQGSTVDEVADSLRKVELLARSFKAGGR